MLGRHRPAQRSPIAAPEPGRAINIQPDAPRKVLFTAICLDGMAGVTVDSGA